MNVAKISKAQYKVLMERIAERQSNPMSSPPGTSSAPPMGMQQPSMQQPVPQSMGMSQQLPQEMPQGMPMGVQDMTPMTPNAQDLSPHIQEAQDLWSGMQGGLGEQLWKLIHGNSGSNLPHDEAFLQETVKHNLDPSLVKDEGMRGFIQSLKDHKKGSNEMVSQLDQAMGGF